MQNSGVFRNLKGGGIFQVYIVETVQILAYFTLKFGTKHFSPLTGSRRNHGFKAGTFLPLFRPSSVINFVSR